MLLDSSVNFDILVIMILIFLWLFSFSEYTNAANSADLDLDVLNWFPISTGKKVI